MLTEVDYSMLNSHIDNMARVEMRMEVFFSEARALTGARYTQHNEKVYIFLSTQ